MLEADWNLLDGQVMRVIRLTLSKNIAHNVEKEKTIKGLMEVLSNMYGKSSTNKKVHLMKKIIEFEDERKCSNGRASK